MKQRFIYIFLACFAFTTGFSDLFAQVSADFSASSLSGCSPLTVSFTDLSTGSPTSWLWDFGNSNTSTLQNPGATYVNPGTYTVTLTSTGVSGSDTKIKTAYITVFADPNASFQAVGPITGCAPFSVSFSDLSTPGSGTINQWLWDFGDGTNSALSNPVHTFYNPGTYTITLFLTDANGCQDGFTQTNFITVLDTPISNFTANPLYSCNAPSQVNFSILSTGMQPLSYQWLFGNGGFSGNQNPVYTYPANGSFDVTLISTDGNGCADTLEKLNYIQITPFSADFNANTTACEGDTVQFTDASTGGPTSWSWNFGDGVISILPNPTHVYQNAGTFTVTLSINSGPNCNDQVIKSNYITVNSAPAVAFGADSTQGCALPFTVNFTDSTPGAVGWFWLFGDGNFSNLQNPTHVYTIGGDYTVKLFVTGANGCSDTLTKVDFISITEPNATFPQITPAPTHKGCEPLEVSLYGQTNAVGPISSWYWNFGDGNTDTIQNPVHIYTLPGIYNVTLVIVTVSGCTDTLTVNGHVAVGDTPTVDFFASDTLICKSEQIMFTNLSTGNEFHWDFGDGSTSTLFAPLHTFSDTGCFSVTLVADSNGCLADTTFDNYVCIQVPVANFSPSKSTLCSTPDSIHFSDLSRGADHWFWDFGNGLTDTVPNPSTVYNSPGVYIVKLKVVNDSTGCSDSLTFPIISTFAEANFGASPTAGCGPLPVNYTDSSAQAVWWWLKFGDGTDTLITTQFQNIQHTFTETGYYWDTLTIKDSYGCEHVKVRPKHILVMGPKVDFSAADTFSCRTLTTQFTDFSFSPVPLTNWLWDFGDGSTDTAQNPVHTFAPSASQYTVALTVTDSGGCTKTFVRPNYISVTEPVPDFTQSTGHSCPGFPLNFTNLSSGIGISHQWYFGDGDSSTVWDPVHTYSIPGNYTISILVIDTNGCDTTYSNTILVDTLTAKFGANPISAPCPPLLANFFDSSNSYITQWNWDFGDGGVSTLPNPSHLYVTAGSYGVSLIVENIQGCADTVVFPQLINVSGPTGSFTFNPKDGCSPLEVNFSANTTNVVNYAWDFGDGNIINNLVDTAFHTYANGGVFHPILIIDDGQGCSVSLLSPDSIVADTGPIAAFSASNPLICNPFGLVLFTDNSSSGVPINSYQWNFGDGATDTSKIVGHIYNGIGSYDVTLIVTNKTGCADTLVKPSYIKVVNPPQAGGMIQDTISICQPYVLEFLDTSQVFDPLDSWTWTFGDGNASAAQNPIHSFADSGNYNIQLLVIDTNGCADSTTLGFFAPFIPTPWFSLTDSTACLAPFTVGFLADTNDFIGWAWDFGDGNTGTGFTTSHTFQDYGHYSPILYTEDIHGCLDTLNRFQHILADSVVANLAWNVIPGCPPLRVDFSDLSVADTTIANWLWDFGSGPVSLGANPIQFYDSAGTFPVDLIIETILGCRDTISLPGPDIVLPPVPQEPEIFQATVENDAAVRLNWEAPFNPYLIEVDLRRSIDGISWLPLDTLPISSQTYFDLTADVHAMDYFYQVASRDSCGESSPESNLGRSIFLQGQLDGNVPELSWNRYEEWENGVASYNIEVFNEQNQQWDLVDQVIGNVLNYRDELTDLNQPEYCYRIEAIELQGNSSFSLSNKVCLNANSRLWAPNVFTPNGDGAFDDFLLVEKNIVTFELNIFTRWGQLVFSSYDPYQGWDGTFEGRECVESVYYYVATGTGVHGARFDLRGNVTLLR